MSEETLVLVTRIRQRLQATIRRLTLAQLLAGILVAAASICTLWLFSTLIEAEFWLSTRPRTVLFGILLVVTVALLGFFVIIPALRHFGVLSGPTEKNTAFIVGTHIPDISDRLVNLLELADTQSAKRQNPILDRAIRMLGKEVELYTFESVEQFGRVRQAGRVASVPFAALLVILLVAPGWYGGAFHRLVSPGAFFQKPGLFELIVEPGSVELLKGQAFDITVKTRGRVHPPVIVLESMNENEEEVEEFELKPDSSGQFHYRFLNVRQSLKYRAAAGEITSDWYDAKVTNRPLLRSMQVTLTYPSYSALAPVQMEPNVGDVTALPGTRISLDVTFGGEEVQRVFLQFDDKTRQPLEVDGTSARGWFTLKKAGAYRIVLQNSRNIQNSDPITYHLQLVDDAAPSAVIVAPEPVTDLNENAQTQILGRITDDFGFSKLILYYRLAESRFAATSETFNPIPIPLQRPRELDQDVDIPWTIKESTPIDPVPGDVIEYYLQVWDNDTFHGFKSARSAVQRLQMPSLAEQYEKLEQESSSAESLIENLMQNTESIRNEFDQLQNEIRRKQESDWEDQRQLEQLQSRQQQLEQRVEDLTGQLESMADRMQENNLVSQETLEAFKELQRVAEEINSPEMMEALRQLQEAMEQLDLQKIQESMTDFKFNEQQYRERLERTLELFKKLKLQQDLDEVNKRVEDLIQKEQDLAEKTREALQQQKPDQSNVSQKGEKKAGDKDNSSESPENKESSQVKSEDLAREQDRAGEEMKSILEKMETLKEKSGEMKRSPQEAMQQLLNETNKQQLPQEMKNNSDQLRQNQLQQARQGQQNLQQQLQQLNNRLGQLQQQMESGGRQINMTGLRKALDDILRLSREQERLRGQVDRVTAESPQLRPYAQRQAELNEGLNVVSDSLQNLAKSIPQMNREVQRLIGESQQEMSQATEAMSERLTSQASAHQKGSMMHLNELALLLSDLLDQMMNSQGGGSGSSMEQMMKSLQQMAGQQQQLNEQIQQMLNDVQGNRLTSDMQSRMRQMSAQQESIRRQLKEMARNPAARGKLLGDLNKIADQMEETIQELQRSQANRQTVRRQQQILSRLLDAQKSLQQKGEENRRDSRSGSDIRRNSPAELTPEEEADKLRRDLIKALESGYAPDYQELIKRYFDLLQQRDPEENK